MPRSSQKKQTRPLWIQEQRLFVNLGDAIPAPIFYKDINGHYLGCNTAFEKFFNIKRQELAGKTIMDLYAHIPKKAKKIHKKDKEFLASGESQYVYESDIEDQEGKLHHFFVTKAKFYHSDGSLGGLVAMMFDNTEQREAQEALHQHHDLLQIVIEAIPSPVFYKDPQGRYLGCNKAFENFTGKKQGEILGKTVLEIFPEKRAHPIHHREKDFLKVKDKQIVYEATYPDGKGDIRDYVFTKAKFYQPHDSQPGIIAITFDVTDQKKLEKEFCRANQELTAKNEQITASIEYASHIQKAILWNPKEIIRHFKDGFILNRPRDIVSGDFYWFAEKDDFLFLAAVDCTGHGVPGALMTVLGNELLNHIVYEQNVVRPDLILTQLDVNLHVALQKRNIREHIQDGMELGLCVFDKTSNQVQFAGAHRPLYWVHKGKGKEVNGSPFPIGGRPSPRKANKNFQLHVLNPHEGDVLYLRTDGFSDQLNPQNKKYMRKNLWALFHKIHALPMKEQKKILDQEWMNWRSTQIQTDDILIIGIQLS